MTDSIKVLNEFLPKAETERLGAIKVGDTLDLDTNNVLNVNESATPKAYMTNCITEIPQDIKLELTTTTLTLKAGSKVYIPNGFEADGTTKHFDEVVLNTDYIFHTEAEGTITYVCGIASDGTDQWRTAATNIYVNTIEPSDPINYAMWWDLTNNLIKRYKTDTSTWQTLEYSLPIAIITFKQDVAVSIDQVFNGFGYIDSAVFALPGVKGLIPNGRNEDGSLKNISFAIDHVLSYTFSVDYTGPMVWGINANNTVFDVVYFTEQNTKPTDNSWAWLNPETNILSVNSWNGSEYIDYPIVQGCLVAKMHRTMGRIDLAEFQKPLRIANVYDVNKKLITLQDTKLDASRIQYVSAIPANPQNGVIYLIAQ